MCFYGMRSSTWMMIPDDMETPSAGLVADMCVEMLISGEYHERIKTGFLENEMRGGVERSTPHRT